MWGVWGVLVVHLWSDSLQRNCEGDSWVAIILGASMICVVDWYVNGGIVEGSKLMEFQFFGGDTVVGDTVVGDTKVGDTKVG